MQGGVVQPKSGSEVGQPEGQHPLGPPVSMASAQRRAAGPGPAWGWRGLQQDHRLKSLLTTFQTPARHSIVVWKSEDTRGCFVEAALRTRTSLERARGEGMRGAWLLSAPRGSGGCTGQVCTGSEALWMFMTKACLTASVWASRCLAVCTRGAVVELASDSALPAPRRWGAVEQAGVCVGVLGVSAFSSAPSLQ